MLWPRGFNAVLFNMAEPCRGVLRLFSASLGSWKASKSFRLICQRNASQAQGCDAGKLRAMVVGLGNHSLPDTRHSVGMLVVDCLARHLGAVWHFNSRSIGHLAVTNVDDQEIILLKPTLAMNINGRSIARTAAMYNVNPSNVILVHDDLDKPVGKYSLKHGGSAGGHNGVRSAIASLSSDTPKRVRVGIGRPNKRAHVTEYVLSKFEPLEIPVVQGTVEKCCKVLIDELQLFKTQSSDTKETENSEGVRVQYLTQQQSVL